MEKETRGDLLRTIESQQEQILRLESRLRDVVNAYKSLLKEKDALQSSVETLQALLKSQTSTAGKPSASAVLRDSATGSTAGSDVKPSPQIGKEQPSEAQATEHVDNEETEKDCDRDDGESHQLKEQLAKLAASMTTLMEERDKMVAAYQAEKKQLKQMYEERLRKSEEQLSASDSDAKKQQDLCSDLRTKLKQERMEKEKLQGEQAVLLRDVQQQLSSERAAKEDLEHQVEDLKKVVQSGMQQQANQVTIERYEAMVGELGCQLQDVKARLKEAERVAALPNPQVLHIQKELANVKEQHRLAVDKEQLRADQAEERAREVARRGEARAAELEKKLAELSEIVGNYERLRSQDQLTVHKLKERVAQLDVENTELVTHTVSVGKSSGTVLDQPSFGTSNDKHADASGHTNASIEMLLLDLANVKTRLKEAAERNSVPLNWQELLAPGELTPTAESVHRKCNEELHQLKEEFERYKLRAQSVLKTKATKDNSSSKEVEGLKSQLVSMRERLSTLAQERHDDEERHSSALEELRRTIAQLQAERRAELAHVQAERERQIGELERELHRHRDRTIALLAEKERELELLRSFAVPAQQTPLLLHLAISGSQPGATVAAESMANDARDDVDRESAATFKELLRSTSASGAGAAAADAAAGGGVSMGGLLQLGEEQARWQGEVAALQRQKRELEAQLREQALAAAAREQQYADLVGALKEEVRRLDRNEARRASLSGGGGGSSAAGGGSRGHSPSPQPEGTTATSASRPEASDDDGGGGVGLEYLKNVVLRFVTSAPGSGVREHMLHAIATVLHFSPQERQQALAALTSHSWWRSSKT